MKRAPGRGLAIALMAALSLSVADPARSGWFAVTSEAQLDAIEARVRAAQFLSRATFGPTHEEIVSLGQRVQNVGAAAAFEEWIERPVRRPSHLPPSPGEADDPRRRLRPPGRGRATSRLSPLRLVAHRVDRPGSTPPAHGVGAGADLRHQPGRRRLRQPRARHRGRAAVPRRRRLLRLIGAQRVR